jgi:hypothetical protein
MSLSNVNSRDCEIPSVDCGKVDDFESNSIAQDAGESVGKRAMD